MFRKRGGPYRDLNRPHLKEKLLDVDPGPIGWAGVVLMVFALVSSFFALTGRQFALGHVLSGEDQPWYFESATAFAARAFAAGYA